MDFADKIVVIIREDLLVWQKLNVTAFLMSGIGWTRDIIGEPYMDGDGVTYLPMSQQPIMIYSATGQELKEILKKALTKDVRMTIYIPTRFLTSATRAASTALWKASSSSRNSQGAWAPWASSCAPIISAATSSPRTEAKN